MYKGKRTLRDIPGNNDEEKITWLDNCIKNSERYVEDMEQQIEREIKQRQERIEKAKVNITENKELLRKLEAKK